jgi:hypothetical protein
MSNGIASLVAACTFEYEDFHLSEHDLARIETQKDSLVKDEKLTREPIRVKQWIGVILVRLMAVTIMEEALKEGTYSWDATIHKVLALLLLSSLQCRVGDIARTRRAATAIFDIRQCMDQIGWWFNNLEKLVARVVIRNEKYHKYVNRSTVLQS